ncbi:nucleotide exchange factor GrpE [Candidatus Dependentiae bacterium]|nr:MAG: nucleotide exchange factor GrpE [Candidatus Dependentiae bacterium]
MLYNKRIVDFSILEIFMSIFFNDNEENNQAVHENENNSVQEPVAGPTVEQVVAEWKQKYAYLNADFENFKRRTVKEYEAMRLDIYTRICKPLLVIMDDFDRACAAADKQHSDIEGFKLIRKSFEKCLTEIGVVEMPVEGAFDPQKHEALLQVQSAEHASGDIVSVLQKGYMLHGAVLRPAKVSVAQ